MPLVAFEDSAYVVIDLFPLKIVLLKTLFTIPEFRPPVEVSK